MRRESRVGGVVDCRYERGTRVSESRLLYPIPGTLAVLLSVFLLAIIRHSDCDKNIRTGEGIWYTYVQIQC